jgi:hypothetical protein
MYGFRRFRGNGLAAAGLAGLALLAWTVTAAAQGISTGGGRVGSLGGGLTAGGLGTSGLGGGFAGGGLGGGFAGGSSFAGGGLTGGGFAGGGTSFSGGGMNFTGGGTSFAGGGTSFTGGGATGGYGTLGGGPGGLRGTSGGVSTSNPFYSYYANPYALGLATGTTGTYGATGTGAAFGQPLYGNLTTNRTGTTGLPGATGTNSLPGGTANVSGGTYPGASSIGVRRAPAYATTLGFAPPLMAASQVQGDAQQAIARSTRLASPDGIQVRMDGGVVVLQGVVPDEHDRRLAEGLVWLTRGVRQVRNELQVRRAAPPAGGP